MNLRVNEVFDTILYHGLLFKELNIFLIF